MEQIKRLVSDDTLYLTNNDIFIAKKGKNIDINTLINKAKEHNPKYIISNVRTNHNGVIYYKNINKLEKNLTKDYNVNPKIIGVTGTNGKTSTTTIIYNLLKKLNQKVMLIGTNGVYFEDKYFKTRNTTPSKLSILYLINKYLDNNSYLVIELSSQSYNRIKDFKIDYLIYTNLSNEHLDYHKTMNRYFKAKLKIMNLLKDKSKLYVNLDDKYANKILKKYKNAKTYSLKDLEIINNDPIEFKYDNKIIKSGLSGDFNIYNIYSSFMLLKEIFNQEELKKYINDLDKIEGRNNVYHYNSNLIVIDYAHTPESMNKIISHYKNLNHNHIYVLFGFGGNKDKKKRPMMINEALKFTEHIILTEDNSRTESFIDIIKSSLIPKLNNLTIIQDRKEAIKYSINKLESNDILLILGKGNEEYLLKNGLTIPYNDKEEVFKWIL